MSRAHLRADDGFGLIELLVTLLILGILVAVALPSLLGQRTKAQDTGAKTAVVTAAKAATAYGTEIGVFTELDKPDLIKLEKALDSARNLQVVGAGKTFRVSVESAAGTTFSVARSADGELTRDCTPTGTSGCPAELDASGNRW
jgi:type IV pilus assembly protein PilA